MIQVTKVDGIEIPEWAKCYCVIEHRPTYIHPIPFHMPDGNILFLCPNSHHQLSTLLKIYKDIGGVPANRVVTQFGTFAQRTAKLCYRMILEKEAETDDTN